METCGAVEEKAGATTARESMIAFLKDLAQTKGASDLLVTVGRPPQLRIYNEIQPLDYPPLTPDDTERLCTSILSADQRARFRAEKEIDMSLSLRGVGRYRLNIYLQRGSLALVARIVSERIPNFDDIGLPDVVRALAEVRRGLLLFTGPTGTGKSTTVAAIVNHINEVRKCHIVAIEDPIEFVHPHCQSTVDQREVGSDTASFQEALRRVLRQSPDVIVIGEMRDRESAQAALTLAETGHLTIGTLHTRGATETVNRLIDMFPPEQTAQIRAQLSTSLQAVVWQQLLPRKDRGGLVLACEVLRVIPAVQALIRAGRIHEICSSMQSGRKHGMCTMEQTVQELVQRGLIEPDATGR
jgi:twitching motility protein PilT